MVDITTIPTSELEKDLLESNQDIAVCETVLTLGVSQYSGGSVKERLEANRYFVKVITAELERRRTKHAPDVVESAASVIISPASEVSASEADSTPATTQVM